MRSERQTVRLSTPVVLVLTMGLMAGVTPARAQDAPVTLNLGLGPIMPTSDVGEHFDTGITAPIGVTFNFSENLGLQFEYMYGRMGGPSTTVPNIDPGFDGGPENLLLESHHSMHTGTFNVIFKTPARGAVGGYVMGGPGFYHRSVTVTTPDVGVIRVCNPWWYICTPVAVPVDRILGSRSSTDFGFNVGGGVTFGNFYVEIRYHYSRGPEVDVPVNLPEATAEAGMVKATGHYIPINFGFRF